MRRSFLFNERGAIDIVVVACCIIVVAIVELAIFCDNWAVEYMDRHKVRIVNDLNLDVYSLLSVEYTAFETGFKITDNTKAYELFRKGLQARFHLDGSMSPLPGSPFSGPVNIETFRIVGENEVPFSDGHGRTMEYPGVYVVLQIQEKTPLLGLEGSRPMLVTTEIYR